jgi:hypothetical protein
MDTSGGTVYFGRYITNENVPLSALCEQIAMYSGLTAIQVPLPEVNLILLMVYPL